MNVQIDMGNAHFLPSHLSITAAIIVIPIVTHDDDTEELSEEELAKRREFERKRKEVATPEGLDIKAVLGHRISIPSGDGDDDEDEDEDESEEEEEEEAEVGAEEAEEWKDDGRVRDTQKLETGDGVAGNATHSSPKCTPSAQKV
ncbi:unnamed protein product [Hydatigera taeniaeformis]|uniref:Prothymosin alpha-like n=1 Tax=Hydatigena taeniaeformis TaxID=6205 RepID=A0A0R3X370_HYDTA|nr:unnamed protein product [Hydatigera taeniaeformis]